MKTLLVVIFSIFSFNLFAQEISSDWFPKIGDELLKAYADNAEDIEIPESGINQTWDFSNAIFNESNEKAYIEPNSLYFSEYFEGSVSCNLYKNPDYRTEHYYKVNQDSFYKTGVAHYYLSGNDTVETISYYYPGIEIRELPYVYGEDKVNDYQLKYYKNGELLVESNATETYTWNGVGTVITPEGTYENCIKLDKYVFNSEGVLFRSTNSFFRNNFSDEIANLTIYYDTSPDALHIYSFSWQVEFTSGTTSIESFPLGFEIFQLENNQFKIESDEIIDLNIQILEINGRIHQQIDTPILKGENLIDIKEFHTNGMYFMVLCDKDSGRFFTHKFTTIK